jgi:hypothetical protein
VQVRSASEAATAEWQTAAEMGSEERQQRVAAGHAAPRKGSESGRQAGRLAHAGRGPADLREKISWVYSAGGGPLTRSRPHLTRMNEDLILISGGWQPGAAVHGAAAGLAWCIRHGVRPNTGREMQGDAGVAAASCAAVHDAGLAKHQPKGSSKERMQGGAGPRGIILMPRSGVWCCTVQYVQCSTVVG